jgi:hypothetical protein
VSVVDASGGVVDECIVVACCVVEWSGEQKDMSSELSALESATHVISHEWRRAAAALAGAEETFVFVRVVGS